MPGLLKQANSDLPVYPEQDGKRVTAKVVMLYPWRVKERVAHSTCW